MMIDVSKIVAAYTKAAEQRGAIARDLEQMQCRDRRYMDRNQAMRLLEYYGPLQRVHGSET